MMFAVAVIALVASAIYLSRPGRTLSTALADLDAFVGTLDLSDEQATMKAQIEAAFAAAGLAWAGPAAVANAYAESRLDPSAIGDNGHSVGLFQLNDLAGAAGYGMSVEARQDPAINVARIIAVAQSEPDFMASYGNTHAAVTQAFAQYVERCALCSTTEKYAREGWLRAIYGDALADLVAT